MANSKTILSDSESIRTQILEIYNDIKDLKCQYIPGPEKSFDDIFNILTDNQFNVVVCGEVKKGKSSMINALIGADILPVNTEVATSQAIRIINDEEKQSYIVYTDGSKESLDLDQLEKYSSQSTIDKSGNIVFDKVIDYLEIHYPIEFLPKEVVLIDTPGIGAMYANHAGITYRQLASASAVVFVTDPSAPITQPEIDFLSKVVNITPYVMFVMTKRDNYDQAEIDLKIERNESILKEKGFDEKIFGGNLKAFPISNTQLFEASRISPEENERKRNRKYDNSGFDPIKAQLLKLILSTIALSKNWICVDKVLEYNTKVINSLTEQEKALDSDDEASQSKRKLNEIKKEITLKWGIRGVSRLGFLTKADSIITSFRNQAYSLFSQGGELYNELYQEINHLQSYDEAKCYTETFSQHMVELCARMWKDLNASCHKELICALENCDQEIRVTISSNMPVIGFEGIELPEVLPKEQSFMEHFNHFRNGFYSVGLIGTLLGVGAVSLTSTVAWIVLPIAAIVGWMGGKKAQLEKLKVQLQQHLVRNLSKLSNTITSDSADKANPMGKPLLTLTIEGYSEFVKKNVQEIYEAKLKEITDETSRIDEIISGNHEKKQNMLKAIALEKNQWRPIYGKIKKVVDAIKSLEETLYSE